MKIDVCQAYTAYCPKCSIEVLLRSDVFPGDRYKCPGCKTTHQIDGIVLENTDRKGATMTHDPDQVI